MSKRNPSITLVTGATGFIGNALIARLVREEMPSKAIIRKPSSVIPKSVPQLVIDLIALPDDMIHHLRDVDVVVHTAARAHIMREESLDPLAEYRRVNRDATLNLAKLAAEAGVRRFVFLSSVKVNGEETFPDTVTEPKHPARQQGAPAAFTPSDEYIPTDHYGLSKYEAEKGLLTLARDTGMEVVIIRPPLVYGPGVKGNFASLMKWAGKGIPLPLGAVHNHRSLVALDNLVDFVVLCSDMRRSPSAANQVFLISDGEDLSTTELLKVVAEAQGRRAILLPIPVFIMQYAARMLGKEEVANRLFGSLQVDGSKAHELLGWEPVVTTKEQLSKMFNST